LLARYFPAAVFVAFPWIRYRFGLRGVLIATTLLAIALGLIVAAA
jgi:Na+/pantothenate symporter